MRRAPLLALAIMAFASRASALDGKRLPTQHMHDAWNEAGGLPQNSVKGIAQTPDGFLWIATEEGLVRFDGVRFRVFDRTTAKGRTSNVVGQLGTDARGALVLLGGKDGVCTFDASTATFHCAPLPNDAEAFALRRVGDEVWVTSSRGVFARRDDTFVGVAEVPANLSVRDVWREPDGTIGVVEKDRGVILFSGGKSETMNLGDLRADDVNGARHLRDGSRWLATKRGAFTLEGGHVVRARGTPDRNVLFVADDAAGNVYLSAFNDGLYVRRGDGFARIPLSESQPSERLDAIFEDDVENLWVGSRLSGLHRLRDGPIVPWGAAEGVTHGFVSAVFASKSGTVLVGTGGGGVFLIDGDRVVHVGEREGLGTPEIDSFSEGHDGSILVGTRHGLSRITSFDPPKATRVAEIGDVVVTGAYEDADDFFVGTSRGLVAPRSGKTFTRADGLPAEWIVAMLRTRDRALWIATVAGLARLANGRAEMMFAKELRASVVATLTERADGSLLVGTSDAGLFLVRGDHIARLHRGEGLFDDTVHATVEGPDGRLWMSCNKGVYAISIEAMDAFFAGRTKAVTSQVFGRADGMRSRECNGGVPAGSRDANGRIWFPTMLGAVAVDPRAVKAPPPPRAPVIETARFNGASVPAATSIELPPEGRSFDVTFTAPALIDPEKTRFEVRLTGAREDWHLTTGRGASFAALGPGSYVFEVRAKNEADVASTPASLVVNVPPRLVETTTFRVLVVASALAVVVLFARLRVRAIERERVTLARLVNERTKELATRNDELGSALADLKRAETDLVRAERMASVATLVRGIAHELNNPLSFVAGNVGPLRRYADFLTRAVREVASSGTKLEELRLGKNKDLAFVERDLGKLLDDVEEGAKRARLIVGDLQSLTDGPSRSIEPVDLAKVIAQSVRLLEPSKPETVAIEVDANDGEPILARAGEMEQAVVNLVDNAIRAVGDRGTIRVTLRVEDDVRIVVVSDDGRGMSESVRARATEPFFTTRAAGEGSGLGLAIVATIAEHHDGAVDISSRPGEGTTVTLRVRSAKPIEG